MRKLKNSVVLSKLSEAKQLNKDAEISTAFKQHQNPLAYFHEVPKF